jgi:hypothetical protein
MKDIWAICLSAAEGSKTLAVILVAWMLMLLAGGIVGLLALSQWLSH